MLIITTQQVGDGFVVQCEHHELFVLSAGLVENFSNHQSAAIRLLTQINQDSQVEGRWTITAVGSLPKGQGYGFIIDLI